MIRPSDYAPGQPDDCIFAQAIRRWVVERQIAECLTDKSDQETPALLRRQAE